VTYVFSKFEQLKASGALPSPNGVALEILRLTQSEDATVAQLAHVLQADPALAGRLVKFVNSAQGGGVRPIVAISDAVRLLGFAAVRQLCLGFSVLNAHRDGRCVGFDYNRYWSRSLATAIAAQTFCARVRVLAPEESFTCGLLADIGSLAIASLHPEPYSALLGCTPAGPSLRAAEREAFGTDHVELGAALLEDWRLPAICVDAVFHADAPEQSGMVEASRGQRLCELMSLSCSIGDYFVGGIEARKQIAPGMLVRAARVGIEAEVLAQLCDEVGEQWQRWGAVLSVRTETPPQLELPADAAELAAAALAQMQSPAALRRGPQPGASLLPAAAPQAPGTEREPEGAPAVPPAAADGFRVMIVSPRAARAAQLQALLAAGGHAVTLAADAQAALALMLDEGPQVVFADCVDEDGALSPFIAALQTTELGERCVLIGVLEAGTRPEDVERPVPASAELPDADAAPAGAVDPSRLGPDDYLCAPHDAAALALRLRGAGRLLALRAAAVRDAESLRRVAADLAVANRRLQRSSLTDALTGLPNRRYAFERLEQEWAGATRSQRPLSCLSLDVDHFRRANAAGHSAGDKALARLAAVLRQAARANDVVCRIGGSEFLVICPDTDRSGAMSCGERLRSAVEHAFAPNGRVDAAAGALTLSIGAVTRDRSVSDVEAMVRLAEGAAQAAKRDGRNRVRAAITAMTVRPPVAAAPRSATGN
jgi:two-component system, cell cycle response regulator